MSGTPRPGHGGAQTGQELRRIVLTGFMGAGKSTAGRLLAQAMGWEFTDLDAAIFAATGLSPAEIFTAHGEAHFRTLECQTVAEILKRSRMVVALGGGALESDRVFRQVHADPATVVVFLRAPVAELLERCRAEGGATVRPLLGELPALESRYAERLPRYSKAHLTIDTSGLPPEDVVNELWKAIRLRLF